MSLTEELALLIKSKHQLIYVETTEEAYVLAQLREVSHQLKLAFYVWSLTEGLRRPESEGSFYATGDPLKMLQMVQDILRYRPNEAVLLVCKDLHRQLKNDLILRSFKDLLIKVKEYQITLVVLAPTYELPVDLEPAAARLVAGYPDDREIGAEIDAVLAEQIRGRGQPVAVLRPEVRARVVEALRGLTHSQIWQVLTLAVVEDQHLDLHDLETIEAYKKKIFDQDGLLTSCPSMAPEQIAGFPRLRDWLSERRESFYAPKPSLPAPRGVLLLGVQGCGKSMAVKAVARVLNLPLYQLDLGRLYSKYIGETEENLRKALAIVDKIRPICLWIDEIEKAFATSDGQVDGGVSQRVLGAFLTWMQERQPGCFIAATANDISRLPPEMLRKGRFDEIFFVDLPEEPVREDIFALHLGKRGLAPEAFDLPSLARQAAGFSGAEIEQVIIDALYSADHRHSPVTTEILLAKLNQTKPLSVIKAEEINALREWARERTVPV